jgi:hypothetical protein
MILGSVRDVMKYQVLRSKPGEFGGEIWGPWNEHIMKMECFWGTGFNYGVALVGDGDEFP